MADPAGATELLLLPHGIAAQAAAQELNRGLALHRRILSADELASLISPRARHEVSYNDYGAYFFTIDGILNRNKITGAMFAGECMLIFAIGPAAAQELANAGLRATIEFLHREFETRALRGEDLGALGRGTFEEVGGRKAKPGVPGEELKTAPKLKAMLAHVIGGLPWKW